MSNEPTPASEDTSPHDTNFPPPEETPPQRDDCPTLWDRLKRFRIPVAIVVTFTIVTTILDFFDFFSFVGDQLCALNVEAICDLVDPQEPPSLAETVVLVAGLAYRDDDGDTLRRDARADELNRGIVRALERMEADDLVLLGVDDRRVGHILGATFEERQTQARALADKLNGDIIIFGVVTDRGPSLSYQPEVIVTNAVAHDSPEMSDLESITQFTEPILLRLTGVAVQADEIRDRLAVLLAFVEGLQLYVDQQYPEAVIAFQQAIAYVEDDSQFAVLYLYTGNAMAWDAITNSDIDDPQRQAKLVEALTWYNALESMANHPRTLIGRGDSLNALAQTLVAQQPQPYREPLPGLNCYNIDLEQDGENPFNIAHAALNCYRLAEEAAPREGDHMSFRNIDITAKLGQANVYGWLAEQGGPYWQDAQRAYAQVIEIYNQQDTTERAEMRFYAGHAYARYGGALLTTTGGETCEAQREVINSYQTALDLLSDETDDSPIAGDAISLYRQELQVRCATLLSGCEVAACGT